MSDRWYARAIMRGDLPIEWVDTLCEIFTLPQAPHPRGLE